MTTDPEEERAKGRIALWLDPDDLRWIAAACSCATNTDDDERDRCGRVRFRANAALHKAGLKT